MERLVYMSLAGRSSKWHLCGKCHVRGIFQLLNLFCWLVGSACVSVYFLPGTDELTNQGQSVAV